ncbi:MAG: cell wall-binding repeat-containing protein [Firmicutes bacterium]|nr:cell wall-binding repeat-containing protein [Bacillota bacterium]
MNREIPYEGKSIRAWRCLAGVLILLTLLAVSLGLATERVAAEETIGIWVGGVEVTEANAADVLGDGGSVVWDNDAGLLTLTNAHIQAAPVLDEFEELSSEGIYAQRQLNIVLKGENTIENAPGTWAYEGFPWFDGIATGTGFDLAISGDRDASLTIHVQETTGAANMVNGIFAGGNCVIYGTTLDINVEAQNTGSLNRANGIFINGGDHGTLTLANSNIEIDVQVPAGEDGYGIDLIHGGEIYDTDLAVGVVGGAGSRLIGIDNMNDSLRINRSADVGITISTSEGQAEIATGISTQGVLQLAENARLIAEGGKDPAGDANLGISGPLTLSDYASAYVYGAFSAIAPGSGTLTINDSGSLTAVSEGEAIYGSVSLGSSMPQRTAKVGSALDGSDAVEWDGARALGYKGERENPNHYVKIPGATRYPVYVQGVQITEDNAADVLGDGTVSYDDERKTLALNGADLTITKVNEITYGAIDCDYGELTIALSGANYIRPGEGISTDWYCNGIMADGDVTIKGKGSLDIEVLNADYSAEGISCDHDITIEDARLAIRLAEGNRAGVGMDGGSVTLKNAQVTMEFPATVEWSGGINAGGNIRLVGGSFTFTSQATTVALESSGDVFITDNANVSLTGSGETVATFVGVNVNNRTIYIQDESSVVIDGEAGTNGAYGLYAGDIDISGNATLDATCRSASGNGIACYGYGDDATLAVADNAVMVLRGSTAALSSLAVDLTAYSDPAAGACVSIDDLTGANAAPWDGETALTGYQYVRIPAPKKIAVSFDANGGTLTDAATQEVWDGSCLTAPQDPVYEPFTFTGWYRDKNLVTPYDFTQPVTKALTLYAGWEGDLTKAEVSCKDAVYDGQKKTPAVSVSLNGTKLKAGTDYVLKMPAGADLVNAGSISFSLTGRGFWKGSATGRFTIQPAPLTGASVEAPDQVYSGKALTPQPVVTLQLAGKTVTLRAGTDYEPAGYQSNTKVGTATVTVRGKGNFTGTAKGTFRIAKASLAQAKVTVGGTYTYTGKAIVPADKDLKVVLNGKTLAKGTDYTVKYTKNTAAGTATVTITGAGAYGGTASGSFTISPAKVAIPKAKSGLTYNGAAQSGVASGAKYTVTGGMATKAGTYTAKATLKDVKNYVWSDGKTAAKTIKWTIAKANVKSAVVATIKSQTFTGTALEPEPVVKMTLNKKSVTLRAGTDYKIAYKNNINPGTATVMITGTGNFTGTVTKSFKIVKAKISFARYAGSNRFQTAYAIADELKNELGVSKFSAVVVADGMNYPDALASAYLANMKKAPILLTTPTEFANTRAYIKKNVKTGSTIYIVGGTGSIPDTFKSGLGSYKIKRLGGANRYGTNLNILKEAKIANNAEIIVCTGLDFADALSASATGKPVLLVGGQKLTDEQVAFLKTVKASRFTIMGGNNVVAVGIQQELKKYAPVSRIAGANAFARSVALAKKYFIGNQPHINLASGNSFPDGLSGGPLACLKGGPLLLTGNARAEYSGAAEYADKARSFRASVFGGAVWVSDDTVKYILTRTGDPEAAAKAAAAKLAAEKAAAEKKAAEEKAAAERAAAEKAAAEKAAAEKRAAEEKAAAERAAAEKAASAKTGKVTVKPQYGKVSYSSIAAGDTVYITDTGKKFHADGCTSLRQSQIATTKAQAEAAGYTYCHNCIKE